MKVWEFLWKVWSVKDLLLEERLKKQNFFGNIELRDLKKEEKYFPSFSFLRERPIFLSLDLCG